MWLRFNPERDALFLDIDGTLLDIAPTAAEVKVPPQLVKNLGKLQKKLGGALAFISGRTIEEIDRLFVPLQLPCAGVHGAQWRLSASKEVKSVLPLNEKLRKKILAEFADMKRVRIEDKVYTLAVHYRQSPELAVKIEERLSSLIKKGREDLVLIRGRKVFEIMQTSHNKGKALERLMATLPFKGRRPVFLGDDVTDLSAIGVCLKYGGVAARVGQGKSGFNAFASPETVRAWINTMMIDMDS